MKIPPKVFAPEFAIIGAAKSGTTSLYGYLGQHPEIAMARIKEARYLGYAKEIPDYRGYGRRGKYLMKLNYRNAPSDWQAYQSLFSHAGPDQIRGESTPAYLYEPMAPQNIHSKVPGAKLIVILRDPVERAYSSYLHMRRENAEPETFSTALTLEPQRIEEGAGLPWRYVDMGKYATQLKRYQAIFPSEQMLILLYDDLQKNTVKVCQDIFRFLGVNDKFCPDVTRIFNASGEPIHRLSYDLLFLKNTPVRKVLRSSRIEKLCPSVKGLEKRMLKRPKMEEEARDFLKNALREDVESLGELLKRDLGDWLK